MAALTIFQKKMAARRGTSSIDKLSRQYQEQIKNITGEYETSFADYTKKRAETMAPFESATEQYKKDYSAYETSASAYKSKLSEYQKKLEDYQKNPYGTANVTFTNNYQQQADGKWANEILVNGQNMESWLSQRNLQKVSVSGKTLTYKNPVPAKFSEPAPLAPEQPTAPEIPEFDTGDFEQKKALTEENYKRELGERKAARLGAVSRKERRPLLSSTQA